MFSSSEIKNFVFDVLETNSKNTLGKWIEQFLFFLILANVLAAVLETLPSLSSWRHFFVVFEHISVVIFLLEYALRLWTSDLISEYKTMQGRLRYAFTAPMLFDFAVIFPSLLHFFFPGFFDTRILRIIRILRVLRFSRYSEGIEDIVHVLKKLKDDLTVIFFLLFLTLVVASSFMYYAEHPVQPENFQSIPHAFYWGISTMATVGYGDLVPQTDLGRLIAIFTVLLGVTLYSLPTAILGATFYAELQQKHSRKIERLEKHIEKLEEQLEDKEDKADKEEQEEKNREKQDKARKNI